ncbi:hypothetical protein GCM10027168_18230 [Streptomyces capparidis]
MTTPGPDSAAGPRRDDPSDEDSAVLLAAALGSPAALARLRRALLAELAALPPDARPHGPDERDDLEQTVWLRMLEHLAAGGGPQRPVPWLRRVARQEARRAADARRSAPVPTPALPPPASALPPAPDERAWDLRRALPRLPGRCPRLLAALLGRPVPTYRELAAELGISQGSIGPVRSRCLACLRRMLVSRG